MRCTQCNYALWQIAARRCPECGSPFKPSDFDFVPNSVRFACPHCDQAYYGTAANGHLVPAAFDCVKCHQPIHMDDMLLLPTEGLEEHRTLPFDMPWLEIGKRYGRLKGWAKTVGCAMGAPGRLLSVTPRESGVFKSLLFFALTQTLVITTSGLLLFLLPIVGLLSFSGFRLDWLVWSLGVMSLYVILPLSVLFLQTSVTHLVVVITGKHTGDFGRTLQALAYAGGANMLSAIPCVGLYQPGAIWWLVSSIFTVAEAQRIPRWRATVSVLALPVGILTLAMTLVLTLGWYGHTFARPAPRVPIGVPAQGSSGTSPAEQGVSDPNAIDKGLPESDSGEPGMNPSDSDAPGSQDTPPVDPTSSAPSTPGAVDPRV